MYCSSRDSVLLVTLAFAVSGVLAAACAFADSPPDPMWMKVLAVR